MADYCLSCVDYISPRHPEGASDIHGPGWFFCEGCGIHLFDERGAKACRSPKPADIDEVAFAPCSLCLVAEQGAST